jgi:hypothetical protein
MSNLLEQMAQMAPQMNGMGQVISGGVSRLLSMMVELIRLNAPAAGYDVRSGATTNNYTDNRFDFSVSPRAIDITIEGNDALVQLSYDGVLFQKEFYVKAGVLYSLAVSCRAMQIKSRVNNSPATFQAMVMA